MSIFSFFSSFYLSLYVMWYYYFVGKIYSISVFFLWLFPIFWRENLICGLFSWVKNIQKWKFIINKRFVSNFSTLCWEKTNFSAYFNEHIPRITKSPRFNLRHHSCKQFVSWTWTDGQIPNQFFSQKHGICTFFSKPSAYAYLYSYTLGWSYFWCVEWSLRICLSSLINIRWHFKHCFSSRTRFISKSFLKKNIFVFNDKIGWK